MQKYQKSASTFDKLNSIQEAFHATFLPFVHTNSWLFSIHSKHVLRLTSEWIADRLQQWMAAIALLMSSSPIRLSHCPLFSLHSCSQMVLLARRLSAPLGALRSSKSIPWKNNESGESCAQWKASCSRPHWAPPPIKKALWRWTLAFKSWPEMRTVKHNDDHNHGSCRAPFTVCATGATLFFYRWCCDFTLSNKLSISVNLDNLRWFLSLRCLCAMHFCCLHFCCWPTRARNRCQSMPVKPVLNYR